MMKFIASLKLNIILCVMNKVQLMRLMDMLAYLVKLAYALATSGPGATESCNRHYDCLYGLCASGSHYGSK